MVWLTRFDGTQFVLNASLIEIMEATPDTVITLTSGHRFVVREDIDHIVQQVVTFRRRHNAAYGEQE
jgi:flagellar protein FlbD